MQLKIPTRTLYKQQYFKDNLGIFNSKDADSKKKFKCHSCKIKIWIPLEIDFPEQRARMFCEISSTNSLLLSGFYEYHIFFIKNGQTS
jgi:hypothetical protein